ncbi:FAD-dependent oxidoreductase [Actinophytocola algeriensis]|uniref:2-polyprenyl-6-methoxyphenol hydroxylase-like FAD-dependent oxidoreductase n=1 Tax=Actinophytocola algeriensis TaxID=1768010 RepID=A0A7W7Q3M0_9PSEU|nr:FAD-dependent monooxygenase [Actinophytocola algeriensis]MBB4906324.1 2-polyprenyl-6-methoxyphenol hydroxylase-like FAD-dependent oxidoreductase [Actinophytocola algeriensis]MBE1477805.1 2-polyprenyl-6-methoxyphenol hydroxylase-like FAD-dependent oxidoreductase [Actinophytocola algeriensis]
MTVALIAGGGIAGPVTAMALRKAGIEATVYEAYDRTADGVGAFLTLAINGLAALRTLDLHTLVREHGFDTPSMSIGLGGRPFASFDFGEPLPDGTVTQTITRAAIHTALRDEAVRRGVRIEYGKRLTSASSTPDGVTATFADGGTAHGDLLVGADGLRSTTRAIIDPSAPPPRYVPLLNAGGYARGVGLDAEPGRMHMAFGRNCFYAYVVHPSGDVWWFANPRQPRELSREELAQVPWREKLLGLFSREDGPATDLIDATEEIFAGWNTYDFPRVPVWHRDRTVIVGDAAHATSPASGQGASMAIEDAVTLGKCLRDIGELPAAFARYEGLRRERVERVVKQGKRNGDGKSLGPVMRHVLPLMLKLAKPSAAGTRWLYGHRIEWEESVVARGSGSAGRGARPRTI